MTTENMVFAIVGAVFGFFLGLLNAYFRKVMAIKLLKTEKRKAVTFVSLFSFLRLAIIAFLIYGLLKFTNKTAVIGAVAGLVLHSIITTFSYVRAKKDAPK